MEVVRDLELNCIIVCFIETLTPWNCTYRRFHHRRPAQTLTDKEYQIMRNASIAVLREDWVWRQVVQMSIRHQSKIGYGGD